MSIMQPVLPGARVLDLYAGSGALGLEALSRGAESADFVDVSPASIKVIREKVYEKNEIALESEVKMWP